MRKPKRIKLLSFKNFNSFGKEVLWGTIFDIESNLPHEVAELVCLKCLHRWVGVYPQQTLLKDIECKCGQVGYVIKTGQTIGEDE